MKTVISMVIRLGDALLFLFALGLFLAFFAPTFFARLDANRYVEDQANAQTMTTMIRDADLWIEEDWDAEKIRQHIQALHTTDFSFIPQARRVEYVYDYKKNAVEALHYATLFTTLDFDTDRLETLTAPEALLGDARILLSEAGNPLAERVRRVTHYVDVRLRSRRTRPYSIERVEQFFDDWIERRMLNYAPDHDIATFLNAFDTFYDPTTTLFVNNDLWSTAATDGEAIRRVVFQPGMAHIPQFDLAGFQVGSIRFTELILPETIRTIERSAFPELFDVDVLTFSGVAEIRAEEGAFAGINTVAGTPSIYVRDDPAFQIDLTYQGQPLVTFDPVRFRETLALDLTHMKNYFAAANIEITSYFISVDLGNMKNTRIYLYSRDGYYGFVVPVQE